MVILKNQIVFLYKLLVVYCVLHEFKNTYIKILYESIIS